MIENPVSHKRHRSDDSVVENRKVDELPPVSKDGITIEFPFSTAQAFDFALAEARKFPTFQQFGEGKKAVYRITIDETETSTIIPLFEHMKGWRKRFVYVSGERVPWDSVFSHLWCYQNKLASFKPQFYCFGYENEWDLNAWGCVQARMPFRAGADWFTWGKWLNDRGDWQFDKERIHHELQKNIYPYRFCPALKLQLIEAVLATIPNVINPNMDSKWKFVESWEDDGRPALKMVTKDEWGYVETKYFVGVEPNGRQALEEISKKVGFQLK